MKITENISDNALYLYDGFTWLKEPIESHLFIEYPVIIESDIHFEIIKHVKFFLEHITIPSKYYILHFNDNKGFMYKMTLNNKESTFDLLGYYDFKISQTKFKSIYHDILKINLILK